MSASLLVQYSEKRQGKCVPEQDSPKEELTLDYLNTLVEHSRTLENGLAKLQNSGTTDVNTLYEAKTASDHFTRLVQQLVNQVPITSKPVPGSTRAGDVFNIPELLEHILLELEPHQILVAQQTNRQWCGTVNSSIKLEQKLGLSADSSGHFYSAFDYIKTSDVGPHRPSLGLGSLTSTDVAIWKYEKQMLGGVEEHMLLVGRTPTPGLFCKSRARSSPHRTCFGAPKLDTQHTFMVEVKGAVQTCGVGKRYRSMLLCQPPIKAAKVKIAVRDGTILGWKRPLFSENGLTLGHLLDAIAGHSMTEHEEVETVTLEHVIELKDTDPIMIARKKEFDAAVVRKAEADKRKAEAGKKFTLRLGPPR